MTNEEWERNVGHLPQRPRITEAQRFGWPIVLLCRFVSACIVAVFVYGVWVGISAVILALGQS